MSEGFEGLSKALAGQRSRRGALGLVGAAVGAGLATAVLKPFRAESLSCPGGQKVCGTQCCSGVCSDASHSCCCAPGTTPCGPSCCNAGVACADHARGICGCPAGTTSCGSGLTLTCCAAGTACSSSNATCTPVTGTAAKKCCTGQGLGCTSDAECCAGICKNGVCDCALCTRTCGGGCISDCGISFCACRTC